MGDEILNKLRYRSESDDLDFKQAQYRFIGGNDITKSEVLKDILAMANAWREGTGYIVLGFKDKRPHPAEVTGINEHIDEAEPTEIIAMASDDSGHSEIKLDLLVQTLDNMDLPDTFSHTYLHFTERFPDYEKPPRVRSDR